MKIIDKSIIIPIKRTGEYIFVNAINGYMGILNEEEYQTISRWIQKGTIDIPCAESSDLYKELRRHSFIVSSNEEESMIDRKTLDMCRRRHAGLVKADDAAVFVLTYMCNFACPYCYEGANIGFDNKIMSKNQVDKIFEMYGQKLRHIAFFGGEPLLPETKDIIRYIISKAPNAKYEITTNGFNLGDFLDEFRHIDFDVIVITLDGSRNNHNATRKLKDGGATYDVIMLNVEKALRQGIPIKIRMNVSKSNVGDCIDLQRKLEEKYIEYFSSNRLRFEMQPIFQLDDVTQNELYEKVLFDIGSNSNETARRNAMFYTVPQVLKPFICKRDYFMPQYCNCDAETHRKFYDPEGNIYSCILALHKKNAIVGEYYPELKYKDNSMLTRNIESIEECSKCNLKYLCGGGCANAVIDENGNAMRPNCKNIKNALFVELPKLYERLCRGEDW